MDLLQACRVKSENAETTAKTQNFILREPCSTLCTDQREISSVTANNKHDLYKHFNEWYGWRRRFFFDR